MYMPSSGTWHFHAPAGEVEVRVRGNLIANNAAVLMAAALAGQGVVYVPTFLAGDALREGRLVRLLADYVPRAIEVDISAVFPSSRNLSPRVRTFVDFLAASVRDPPPWDHDLF
jgi:DNA-binding transcriptional LysR family regulator